VVRALRIGEERVREVVEVTRVSGRVLPPKRDFAERVGEGVAAERRAVETGLGGSERTVNDIHCLPYNICNFLPVSRTMIVLSTTRGVD
jgi:hypothetical protein